MLNFPVEFIYSILQNQYLVAGDGERGIFVHIWLHA
jgi:hypothetical protein